jgi:lysophospholipase L1-like esterase
MGGALRALAVLLATLLALAAPAAAQSGCAAPAELTRLDAPLPRTAERLRSGARLRIVALGSSSTAGFGASAPGKSYPARLGAELRRRLPGHAIEVLNKGVGGEEAADMLRRFEKDVLGARPDLVIWQLGTNSVVRDQDLGRFEAVMREGVGRLRAAGIDLLLMDMQFAPKVTAQPRHLEMERRIEAVAAAAGVPVFRRFALMRHWVESGQLTLKRMLSPDGLHLNDLSYGCLAAHVAEAIIVAAGLQSGGPVTSSR